MEALGSSRFRARVEIICGFAVSAVGALIGLASWASGGNFAYSSRFDIEEYASVLAFVFTVAAWYFLTQLTVGASGAQRHFLRRALACFALEEASIGVGSLELSLGTGGMNWSIIGNTWVGAGALLAALGFFSMMLAYRDEPHVGARQPSFPYDVE